jgi:predicted metal-dependent RNase
MTDLEKAARQALEFIDANADGADERDIATALREALAEQPAQQEPVAWMEMVVANLVREGVNKHRARELAEHFIKHTSPPPQRTWVGLTDEEIDSLREANSTGRGAGWRFNFKGFAHAIEAKLKEKNT